MYGGKRNEAKSLKKVIKNADKRSMCKGWRCFSDT